MSRTVLYSSWKFFVMQAQRWPFLGPSCSPITGASSAPRWRSPTTMGWFWYLQASTGCSPSSCGETSYRSEIWLVKAYSCPPFYPPKFLIIFTSQPYFGQTLYPWPILKLEDKRNLIKAIEIFVMKILISGNILNGLMSVLTFNSFDFSFLLGRVRKVDHKSTFWKQMSHTLIIFGVNFGYGIFDLRPIF